MATTRSMKALLPRILSRNTSVRRQQAKEDLVVRIQGLVENERRCKEVLETKGDEAQKWLDLLQALSSFPGISPTLRSSIFKMIIHLSKRSGLCPLCLTIENVKKIGEHPVGGGGFGDVWKGMIGEQVVCLKVVKVYLVSDVEELLQEYMREAIVWKQLKHPNLLPFLGMYYLNKTREQLCLVSPWMERGNLVRYLKDTPRRQVDHLALAHDVAAGLSHLHSMKIAHGDLKGVNVLMTPEERACIGDFGLSYVVDSHALRISSSTSGRSRGTLRWLAPELLLSEKSCKPSAKSDMYAYGCVCYEIFAGCIPFHGLTEGQALLAVAMDKKHPPRPDPHERPELEDSIWEMMVSCWDGDPSLRATALDVLAHLGGMKSSKTGRAVDPAPDWNYSANSEIWHHVKQPSLDFDSLVQMQKALNDALPEELTSAEPNTSLRSLVLTMRGSDLESSLTPVMQRPKASFSRDDHLLASVAEEILESERKYIQTLELMQKYSAVALNTFPSDNGLYQILSYVEQLLDVQRRFLVRLEAIGTDVWDAQQWGQEFVENETELLEVYVPYAKSYPAAHSYLLLPGTESTLYAFNYILNPLPELAWCLTRPLSRIRNYPLLLDSLVKASVAKEPPHSDFDMLKAGVEVAKRVANRVNETICEAENALEAAFLRSRVHDWEGYNFETFGKLVLQDVVFVTKKGSRIEKEYRAFLFEKILLFFKQISVPVERKSTGTLLPSPTSSPPRKSWRQSNTKLLLKGKIQINNTVKVESVKSSSLSPTYYPLAVWWKASKNDDLDYFVIQARHELQMRKWAGAINNVVRATMNGKRIDNTRRFGKIFDMKER